VSGKYWESCWDDEKNLAVGLARDEHLQNALWEKTDKILDKVGQEVYVAAALQKRGRLWRYGHGMCTTGHSVEERYRHRARSCRRRRNVDLLTIP
ncbi:hypothetical protein TELCIR_23723, partial [Teladorsagia circumcincta]